MSELDPPPEAVLIERLRTEARPKLSIRAAADAAGISDARWRQIAKGHNQASKDVRVPARAPADTLARMARVVGATPQQLRDVGRDDAANELEQSSLQQDLISMVRQGSGTEDVNTAFKIDRATDNLQRAIENSQQIAELVASQRNRPATLTHTMHLVRELQQAIRHARNVAVHEGGEWRGVALETLLAADTAIELIVEQLEQLDPHEEQENEDGVEDATQPHAPSETSQDQKTIRSTGRRISKQIRDRSSDTPPPPSLPDDYDLAANKGRKGIPDFPSEAEQPQAHPDDDA